MPPCLFDHARYGHLSFGFCAAGTERAYYTLDPLGNLRPCNQSPLILGNMVGQLSELPPRRSFRAMAGSRAMKDFMTARPAAEVLA